jgi:hypothetical protein
MSTVTVGGGHEPDERFVANEEYGKSGVNKGVKSSRYVIILLFKNYLLNLSSKFILHYTEE